MFEEPHRHNQKQRTKMKTTLLQKVLICLLGLAIVLPAAAKVIQEFSPRVVIGDGKNGRVFKKWVQPVKNLPIYEVRAKLYRQSGGNDCYVNLRFGEDGAAFENGRRVHLTTSDSVEVRWKVGNQKPNGKPLVMNAYNGTVLVRYVTVRNDR